MIEPLLLRPQRALFILSHTDDPGVLISADAGLRGNVNNSVYTPFT